MNWSEIPVEIALSQEVENNLHKLQGQSCTELPLKISQNFANLKMHKDTFFYRTPLLGAPETIFIKLSIRTLRIAGRYAVLQDAVSDPALVDPYFSKD